MKMESVIYFIFLFMISVSSDMDSQRAMEGYPNSLLGDCPGSDKPVIITSGTLRYLAITVQGPGNVISARQTRYNYYEMGKLARDPNVDFRKPTFLFVGGFLDSPVFPFPRIIGKHYKELGYNVLLLDTNYFTTTEYPLAVRYMRSVAKHTAEMLANLTKEGLNPKKLELAGLSLGSQVSSFIAKNYRLMTGVNISRITGLDPAGPCFRNLGPDERLDKTDADFVDVISTNINGLGMAIPVGHVNFYVNGGEYQPGDLFGIPCITLCSHVRSFFLWLAALEYPNSFIAIKCDSVQQARDRKCYDREPLVTNILGRNTDKSKQGLFYLATRNDYPYYLGKNGLKKEYDVFTRRFKALYEHDDIKL